MRDGLRGDDSIAGLCRKGEHRPEPVLRVVEGVHGGGYLNSIAVCAGCCDSAAGNICVAVSCNHNCRAIWPAGRNIAAVDTSSGDTRNIDPIRGFTGRSDRAGVSKSQRAGSGDCYRSAGSSGGGPCDRDVNRASAAVYL